MPKDAESRTPSPSPHPSPSRDHHKLFSRSRWTGKSSSPEHNAAAEAARVDEQVEAFLGPPTTKPSPHRPTPSTGLRLDRLDTANAKRWPNAVEHRHRTNSNSREQSRQSSRGRSASPLRNKKDLVVKFADEQPEIIGEGGDEAETAPVEISKRRARSHSPSLRQEPAWTEGSDDRAGRHPLRKPLPDPPGTSTRGLGIETSQEPAIRRKPVSPGRLQAAMDTSKDAARPAGTITEAPLKAPEATLPLLRSTPKKSASISSADARMREEEGKALHQAVQSPGGIDGDDDDDDDDVAKPGLPLTENISQPWQTVLSHEQNPSPAYSLTSSKPVANSSPSRGPSGLSQDSQSQSSPSSRSDRINDSQPSHALLRKLISSQRPPGGTSPDQSLEEFVNRVQHLRKLFLLAAESVQPLSTTTLAQWTRAGLWWFLKGRGKLERVIRGGLEEPTAGVTSHRSSQSLNQAFLDIAKAWWINEDMIPHHPAVVESNAKAQSSVGADESVDELLEVYHAVQKSLRALTASMKKNRYFPPGIEHPLLAQGLDTSIWLRYTSFPPLICDVLSGKTFKSESTHPPQVPLGLQDRLPLGDTGRNFCYGRIFVDLILVDEAKSKQAYRIACMLTMLRDRTEWNLKVAINSQNGLVNLCIGNDSKQGATWDDIQWRPNQDQIILKASSTITLSIEMAEQDYEMVYRIFEHTKKAHTTLQAGEDEVERFHTVVKKVTYSVFGRKPTDFPTEPINRCTVKLFERVPHLTPVSSSRKRRLGYRLAVVTNPKGKAVSRINQEIGGPRPLGFEDFIDSDETPALRLRMRHGSDYRTVILQFEDSEEQLTLLSIISGTLIQRRESVAAYVPLKYFHIAQGADGDGSTDAEDFSMLQQFGWHRLKVIQAGSDEFNPAYKMGANLARQLRICAESEWGTISDKVFLGRGAMQWRIEPGERPELWLFRAAQPDVSICLDVDQAPNSTFVKVDELLGMLQESHSIFQIGFSSLKDLHQAQKALTGFSVQFDGVAREFAISRRRMVVPLLKRWEADKTRIQIVKRENVVQLVVFFTDFSHGSCMNFQLKATDSYESFSKSGKHIVRMVDAKFPLPKGEDGVDEFVCLETPDFAGEHDDIHVYFDKESERDGFLAALPGSVHSVSKVGSLLK